MKVIKVSSEDGEENRKNINTINDHLTNKKGKIFMFLYMDNCGHCIQAKKEWDKISESKIKEDDLIVAEVNHMLFDKFKNVGEKPMGFPTFKYIKGGDIEEYDGERTHRGFVDFIIEKNKSKNKQKGVSKIKKGNKTNKRKNKNKTTKIKKRKWSLKYKRSINCNRPKGFSQMQYCKYGRNKTK